MSRHSRIEPPNAWQARHDTWREYLGFPIFRSPFWQSKGAPIFVEIEALLPAAAPAKKEKEHPNPMLAVALIVLVPTQRLTQCPCSLSPLLHHNALSLPRRVH